MDILILPGDGIGPEITQATVRVLEALNVARDLGLELTERDIGFAALDKRGNTLPDSVLDDARAADGVVLGPVSTLDYPPPGEGGRNPSAMIRVGLDLYANIRPARTRKAVPCVGRPMDVVVARENTEGFYADRNMFVGGGEFMPTDDVALAVRKITRRGSERIARAAFELAMRRHRHVTIVHKANVMKVTDGLFIESVHRVADGFPEVRVDQAIVDAMTALMVRDPSRFDVILTTNMFGDILSDEAAELAGGLGLAGALNHGDEHAVAQATHGSAPDIAGRNVANPTALMVSAAMLLEWLGARHDRADLRDAAGALERAVDEALADPERRTPDLGGTGGTDTFAQAVVAALRS